MNDMPLDPDHTLENHGDPDSHSHPGSHEDSGGHGHLGSHEDSDHGDSEGAAAGDLEASSDKQDGSTDYRSVFEDNEERRENLRRALAEMLGRQAKESVRQAKGQVRQAKEKGKPTTGDSEQAPEDSDSDSTPESDEWLTIVQP